MGRFDLEYAGGALKLIGSTIFLAVFVVIVLGMQRLAVVNDAERMSVGARASGLISKSERDLAARQSSELYRPGIKRSAPLTM